MISAEFIMMTLNLIIIFVEGVISARILLKLMGAAVAAPFVRWIYETSRPLTAPFEGMFPSARLQGPFTLEFSSVFALFAYMFIGYVIQEMISYLNSGMTRSERAKKEKGNTDK